MAQPSRVEFVQLTGQPRALAGQDEYSFVPDKRFQLLAYLAYNGDWIGRERLAFLFWPDTDVANSKQNLRGLLQRLRSVPWAAEVEVTPHHLRWAPETDIRKYREALAQGRDDAALEAYRGPLLSGLESDDDGEFSEWLEIERQRLYGDWRGAALRRMRELPIAESRSVEGLLRRLLEADPLDEEAVRAYLNAAARSGQVIDARSVYRNFTAFLQSEMGLEPTSETEAAYEEVLRVETLGEVAKVTPESSGQIQPSGRERLDAAWESPHSQSLPIVGTSFVGRESEITEVVARLRDPLCRVLTLLGTGGVGKTRLAIRAAELLKGEFDTVIFVPLDSVASSGEVPAALAGAVGVRLLAGEDPLAQVARALDHKRVLLVLDNFEHLLDAAPVITALVAVGTGVKLMVSSRERLGLESEWLYPLEGLQYPSKPASLAEAVSSPAVRLFLERARRVRPGFDVGSEDVDTLVELCRRLDGMPLAIELAAAWVRALSLKDIVEDARGGLDLLASSSTDSIPRHQSIRATFEQSWSLLGEGEQGLLRRLAVFRTPVPLGAASYVAGATNHLLASLVDKSLLRLAREGRYDRHPLLLDFAREKLAANPSEEASCIARHASYYLRFLRERTDRARGPQPAETLAEIDSEMGEILAAARTARQMGNHEQLVALMQLLAVDTGYLVARGYGPDTFELLDAAADTAVESGWFELAHGLMGRVADAYGVYRADWAKARDAYLSAADLARRTGNRSREAVFVSMVGAMENRLSPSSGFDKLDLALSWARTVGDDLCLATVLEHRAFVLGSIGDFSGAKALYEESLEAVNRLEVAQVVEPYELHRRRFFALVNLGEMSLQESLLSQGEGQADRLLEAKKTREAALRIAEGSGNPVWTAHALHELGELYGLVGERDLARHHLWRAWELYKENHVTAHMDRLVAEMTARGYEIPQ